ncbi:hypothetical protein LTR94_024001, partial [Friedmanniomyces endolithicus]
NHEVAWSTGRVWRDARLVGELGERRCSRQRQLWSDFRAESRRAIASRPGARIERTVECAPGRLDLRTADPI